MRTIMAHLQVLTEAYVAQRIDIPQHQLLSLVLCEIGDSDKVIPIGGKIVLSLPETKMLEG